ncbi:MAG: hypothetical protein WA628_00310 [Terriglobales bacterium]
MRTVIALLLLGALAAPSLARSKPPAPPVNSNYVSALATANDFLHAWQTQDQETGTLLLTDQLKQRTAEESLNSFFSSAVRPQSFEIGRGKKLGAGRYQFPISLFARSAKASSRWTRPRTSALIVVRAGKSDWAIDKLP